MPERRQYQLFEFKPSDRDFLRKVGIKPCVIDDAFAGLLPAPLRRERRVGPTEMDTRWLKECGVAWEQRPAVQLSLGSCGRQEAVQETYILAEVRMKKQCSSCNGTGKCPQCKGTGRLGYPGYGQVDAYKTPCLACQRSGVCRVCRGTGQK